MTEMLEPMISKVRQEAAITKRVLERVPTDTIAETSSDVAQDGEETGDFAVANHQSDLSGLDRTGERIA